MNWRGVDEIHLMRLALVKLLLSLTRFVKKILATFISLNKFIMKIYSKIYLMMLIVCHKY
jgi:hypothetical protein